ncbi:response regulator transcription factor [Umezawaea sp.]|uniref:helix-turn-helix transcriptional regulator n=1 Tax=Umezawaea sp. TaxID=1955258 RepID=UPI002ED4B04F
MSTHRIPVVVYDGDPLSRAGVIEFLEDRPDVVVLDEAGRSDADRAWSVGVVLVDVLDAGAVVRLRTLVADMGGRVVLVVGDLDEPQVEMVRGLGARSVVHLHHITPARLVKAVRSVFRGGGDSAVNMLSHLSAQARGSRRGRRESISAEAVPTERELEVLRLVSEGFDTREIAERLSLSERTVKGVLSDVMRRKHLRNRAHAVAFAVREGYI